MGHNDRKEYLLTVGFNTFVWFQILLVEFGGEFNFIEPDTTALEPKDWGICIAFGAAELIWHQVVILVPVDFNDGIQMVNSAVLFRRDPEFEMVSVKTE